MTPPPGDGIDRLRSSARLAALLSGLVFVALGCAIVVVSREQWYAQTDSGSGDANAGIGALVSAVTLALLYLALAWRLGRPGDPFATGATLVTGSAMWLLLALFFLRSCLPAGYGGPLLLHLVVGMPIVLVGAVALFIAQMYLVRYGRSGAATWAGRLAPIEWVAFAAVGWLSATGAYAGYHREDAVRAVWRLHACAHRWAARDPARGFPASETELASTDSTCRADRVAGDAPFVASYRPARRDSGGRVSSYEIRVRQRHVPGLRHESLLANEAGLVHIAFRREATVGDHIVWPLPFLDPRAFAGCIELFRSKHAGRGYPRDLAGIQEIRCASVEPLAGPNVIERHGYRVTYEPVGILVAGGDTLARGYTLHARPIVYGETGVRSYFVSAGGVMTATGADRAAGSRDAPMVECEFDPMTPWRSCAQPPTG